MRVVLLTIALAGCQLVFSLPEPTGDAGIPPVDRWRAVRGGFGHTCALDVDDKLYCWGRNFEGELGRLGTGDLTSIREIAADGPWLDVATSNRHTCAIKADHTAWCWGANDRGQLGNNSTVNSTEPVAISIGATHAIAASELHTCAIDDNRAAWCWGKNGAGELGIGIAGDDVPTPTMVASGMRWDQIAVGTSDFGPRSGTTCAIAEDRTLWCWGVGLATETSSPTPVQFGTDTWRAISLGRDHACGITEAGGMRCWGQNLNGQLGNGLADNSATPVGALVANEDRADWTSVAVNGDHSCGVADGHWYCWGASVTGQLGLDGVDRNPVPVELGAGTTWSAVGAGVGHTCAIASDRTMWCVGGRGFGQLGDGSTSRQVPVKLDGAWASVAIGETTTCAIDTLGVAHCTGNNVFGLLGNGTRNWQQRLTPIDAQTTWTEIAPGQFHSCGIRGGEAVCWGGNYVAQSTGSESGSVLSPTAVMITAIHATAYGEQSCAYSTSQQTTQCWGANQFGQLGRAPSPEGEGQPPAPIVTATFAEVDVGNRHACGIDANGQVRCWGSSDEGRLGRAVNGPQSAPTPVDGLLYAALSVGHGSTCAIDFSGTLRCWGANYNGELGLGNKAFRQTPTVVGGTWSEISVGADHACGLSETSLLCWGSNDRGQLGIDSFVDVLTPMPVPGDQNWLHVAAGAGVTCAIDTNAGLWCWGDNSMGQLGTNDAWTLEPVQVIAN